jgi:hypothetical protein
MWSVSTRERSPIRSRSIAVRLGRWACLGSIGVGALIAAGPAMAGPPRADRDHGSVGIQLLDAPVSRRNDPRALRYIVDHLAPGAVIRRRVQVVNSSSTSHRVLVSAGPAAIHDGEFDILDDSAANELTSWISFDRTDLDLAPWRTANVAVTIRVPTTAVAGEQYGVIWAAVGSRSVHGGIVQVNRVGVRVYLDIGPGGEPRSDLKIGDLTTYRAASGEPSLRAHVRNTGARALDLTGSLDLADGPAGLRAGPFGVLTGTTLGPGQSGEVTVALPASVPNGPWTATLTVASGTVHRTVTATITFPDPAGAPHTAHPWTGEHPLLLSGAAVALALAVLAALIVAHRRSQRRQLERR